MSSAISWAIRIVPDHAVPTPLLNDLIKINEGSTANERTLEVSSWMYSWFGCFRLGAERCIRCLRNFEQGLLDTLT